MSGKLTPKLERPEKFFDVGDAKHFTVYLV